MNLAIFDLDNTLIAGDSDHAWGEFLVEQNLVDQQRYKAQNDQFYADYCAGKLNIIAYSEFVFSFLAQHDLAYLQQLHNNWISLHFHFLNLRLIIFVIGFDAVQNFGAAFIIFL